MPVFSSLLIAVAVLPFPAFVPGLYSSLMVFLRAVLVATLYSTLHWSGISPEENIWISSLYLRDSLVPEKNPLLAFIPIGENLLSGLIAVKQSQERHALDGYSLLITILSSLESNQLKSIHLFCIAGFTLHSNIIHPAYRSNLYLTF